MPFALIAFATSRISLSLTLHPNLFQLFHPIGGVRASPLSSDGGVRKAATEITAVPARTPSVASRRMMDRIGEKMYPSPPSRERTHRGLPFWKEYSASAPASRRYIGGATSSSTPRQVAHRGHPADGDSAAVTEGSDVRAQLQATLGAAYTIERELGGGGMARVFLAEETRLGRRVVVKLLSPELGARVSAERFEREIKLAARLQHPHIVPLLAAGDVNGLPYYTMPYVAGASLRERLQAGPMPANEALGILRDVAKALAYAHRQGIVHRDIKPENVLLSEGTAMVADFGVAKAVEAATHDGAARATGLTTAGVAIGTPAYMAPEQAVADGAVDQRADLYALGVIAYELL